MLIGVKYGVLTVGVRNFRPQPLGPPTAAITHEVVFAELAGLVTPRLEQLGDRHVAGLDAFLRTRQPDLEQAGAEADLPGDEGEGVSELWISC
jgi:histidine ammonia-lyase